MKILLGQWWHDSGRILGCHLLQQLHAFEMDANTNTIPMDLQLKFTQVL